MTTLVKIMMAVGVTTTMAKTGIAADRIAGTWKLDLANSKFASLISPPKEQTEVYRELASGEIEMVLTRVTSEGATTSTRLLWPAVEGR
jgi:hypothetical protein